MPHTYRRVEARQGTRITIEITGEPGGAWTLQKQSGGWQLFTGVARDAASRVVIEPDLAWRLFSRGVSLEGFRPRVGISGDEDLGLQALQLISIMA